MIPGHGGRAWIHRSWRRLRVWRVHREDRARSLREILAELLSTLGECAPGTLSVAQLEGDAVFWLCGEDAPELVDLLGTEVRRVPQASAVHDHCHDVSLPSVRLCRRA